MLSNAMRMAVGGLAVGTGEGPHGLTLRLSDQLYGAFDKALGALWMRMRPQPRPCFNPDLLEDMRRFDVWIRQNQGIIRFADGQAVPVRFIVVMSDVPGVFNLGGDLDRFVCLIESRDRDGLLAYGSACVDALFTNCSAYDLPITTIALVQGEALGGGFEAALSSDLIVAERRARFGFPEILFNLFPGMGAASFVSRRIRLQKTATELISSGEVHDAATMLQMGLVDHVFENGSGEQEVARLMRRFSSGQEALLRVRRRTSGPTHAELQAVVEEWVDTALRIGERDLRLMQAVVKRQGKLGTRS